MCHTSILGRMLPGRGMFQVSHNNITSSSLFLSSLMTYPCRASSAVSQEQNLVLTLGLKFRYVSPFRSAVERVGSCHPSAHAQLLCRGVLLCRGNIPRAPRYQQTAISCSNTGKSSREPLPIEHCTFKTFKARFWHWLSDSSP